MYCTVLYCTVYCLLLQYNLSTVNGTPKGCTDFCAMYSTKGDQRVKTLGELWKACAMFHGGQCMEVCNRTGWTVLVGNVLYTVCTVFETLQSTKRNRSKCVIRYCVNGRLGFYKLVVVVCFASFYFELTDFNFRDNSCSCSYST